MKKINEIFSYKESDPEKFWNDLTSLLLEEYKSTTFAEELKSVMSGAYVCFLSKKSKGDKFPYHVGYYVQSNELQFRYFVQMTALNEYEIEHPMPIITGIYPFPGEQCYTFHIHDNGQGEDVVDVFAPHMIDHYARRAYRLPNDLSMPNTWHKDKRQPDEFDFNDKEVKKLFMLVGKFFARNKINNGPFLNEKVLSHNEQESSSNNYFCLWMDGLTYCVPFCKEKIWLHKTFLPYFKDESVNDDAYLGEDQLQAIKPYLEALFKIASQSFPNQYITPYFDVNMYNYVYEGIYDLIIPTLEVLKATGGCFSILTRKGYIQNGKIQKYPLKKIIEATNTLNRVVNGNLEYCDNKMIAESFLIVWSCLCLNFQEFKEWYLENEPKKILKRTEYYLIVLMRGMYLQEIILSEANLLSKAYESEIMKNLLSNQ
jgi:hypothetical protein